MRIAKHTVATIDYTLTDNDKNVIDTSEGGEPLSYIHGTGSIIPGLEDALTGKSPGDALRVSVPPAQGYGERDDSLLKVVPKDRFETDDIEVGMQFHTSSDNGHQVITVVDIEGDKITVDGNHPLAGVTLNFDVKVVGVRQATQEELDHGHAHGGDGHAHDH